jgi:TonB family protein
MSFAAGMTPEWKHWEGDIVDGEFPLDEFLGAGELGAVFRTRLPSGDGAVKLVPAGDVQAAHLLEAWKQAQALEHPHLIRILSTGTWRKGGVSLAYLVMEYADENLATVLAERALTGGETLEMLQPVAQALAFLHDRGLVHGRLKPSNILAVNDTLKISSDSVAPGEASEDLRRLAATMVHALTQRPMKFEGNDAQTKVIDRLPEPFREIARNCAGESGRSQWSAAELAGWLQSQTDPALAPSTTAAAASRSIVKKRVLTYCVIVLALFAVAVLTVGGLLRHGAAGRVSVVPSSSSTKDSEQTPATSLPISPPVEAPAANKMVRPRAPAHEPPPGHVIDTQEQVVRQVLPEIPAKARRTVNGKAIVAVRVVVDPSGKVTDAALQPGGSRYFGKFALAAARNWLFVAGGSSASREWLLRFEITRTDTKVFLEKSEAR